VPSATSVQSPLYDNAAYSPPATRPEKMLKHDHAEEGLISSIYFAEFFAGSARLTDTLRKAGVRCRDPDDLESGGTDFEDASQVRKVREELRALRTGDLRLILHLAIPCSTFSRARDRSDATRLRSSKRPGGREDLSPAQQAIVDAANRIADHAWDLAVWAAKELKAVVVIENPKMSHLWDYLDSKHSSSASPPLWRDIVISQCRFGTVYRKEFGGSHRTLLVLVLHACINKHKPGSMAPLLRTPLYVAGTCPTMIGKSAAFSKQVF
jgi:hypothetical protein